MGWSFTFSHDTKTKAIAYLTDPAARLGRYKLLDKAVVGNHLWMAVEDTTDGTRHLSLDLLSYSRHDQCWGYKSLTESSGPTACDCPLRLLDLVPEPKHNYGWRERVRAHHARAAERKRMVAGTPITLYGDRYRLDCRLGRRGWKATRLSDGAEFRIKAHQMKDATP